jgi:hypothetical protein
VSPVHLVRSEDRVGEPPSRVPVVVEPFWIGRDPLCDLCVWDLRVSRRHAKVRRVRGEYMLSGEGTHPTFVNGRRATLFSLRSGDEIALTAPEAGTPVRLRFENSLEDVFVSPDASLSDVWMRSHGEAAGPGVVGRYDLGPPLDEAGLSAVRRATDRDTGAPVALKVLGRVEPGAEGDRFLRLGAALAGATHPSLARVVEAGISTVDGRHVRWLAMAMVPGRSAALRVAEGPQPSLTALRRMRGLADALHLLHLRGVVHGDVVPANVLLRPDGGATLLDFARSFRVRDGVPASVPLVSDPAYLAPEVSRLGATDLSVATDVYGLAAAGHAMLTGRPPSGGVPPPGLPGGLEAVWRRALHEEPARRPSAEEFALALAQAAPAPAAAPRPA